MNRVKKYIREKMPGLYEFLKNLEAETQYRKRKNTSPEDYPRELEKSFYAITGKVLDIKHPITYSQKMQWLKLYDPNPLRSMLTDKVAVRDWVTKTVENGERYLIPIYGVYDKFDDIDFSSLPESFVLKTNHSSGWNIVVRNKAEFDIRAARKKVNKWMKMDYSFWTVFEPHYSEIKPKIIIEKYMEDSTGNLTDYKILCFDSKPMFVWVDFDRYANHKRNVYDLDWNLQPWTQYVYGNYEGEVDKPIGLDEMIRLAERLCQGFIHVRVDLYNLDGQIYFGEMTFTNGSGLEQLYPTEYEKIIGDLIKIPTDTIK